MISGARHGFKMRSGVFSIITSEESVFLECLCLLLNTRYPLFWEYFAWAKFGVTYHNDL